MDKTAVRNAKPRSTKEKAKADPAAHIMPPPKGYRTLSRRQIKAAVDKVFRERAAAGE